LSKKSPLELNDSHPFGELIGLNFTKLEDGYSRCVLEVKKKLLNPYNYLHGGRSAFPAFEPKRTLRYCGNQNILFCAGNLGHPYLRYASSSQG